MNPNSQGSIIVFIPVEYPLNSNYKKAIAYNIGVMAVKLPGYVFDIVVCNEKSESMDLLKEIEYYKTEHAIPNRITVLEVHEKIYMSLFLYRYLYPYKIRDYSYLLVIKENVQLHPLFNMNTFIDFYTQRNLGVLSPSVKTLELPFQYASMVDMSAEGQLGSMATLRNVSQVDIGFIMMSITEYRKLYNVLATQVANQANGLEQSIYLTGLTIGIMDGFPMEVVPMTGSLSIASKNMEMSNCLSVSAYGRTTESYRSIYPMLDGVNIMNIPIGKSLNLKEDTMLSLYDLLSINMSVNSDMESQLSVSVSPSDICGLFYLFEQFRNKPPNNMKKKPKIGRKSCPLDKQRSPQGSDPRKKDYGYGYDDYDGYDDYYYDGYDDYDYEYHDYDTDYSDIYNHYYPWWWWRRRPWWWWRRYNHYPHLYNGDNYPYWENQSDYNLSNMEDYLNRSPNSNKRNMHHLPTLSINSVNTATKGKMNCRKPKHKMELEIGMENGGECMCICMSHPFSHYPLPCILSIPSQISVSQLSIAEPMAMNVGTQTRSPAKKGTEYETTAWGFKGCHDFDAVVYSTAINPMTVNIKSPYLIKL